MRRPVFDWIDASRKQGEIEAMLIECYECLAPLRDHPRYRQSPSGDCGIPEGVVANAVDWNHPNSSAVSFAM